MDKELCGVTKRLPKGLMKLFSSGSTMWRGWKMIGLLRESMWVSELVVVQWVGCGGDGLIP